MADKLQNPVLNRKRLSLRKQEQLLSLDRNELRIMELEDDIVKTRESIENTKRIIAEIDAEIDACDKQNLTKEN